MNQEATVTAGDIARLVDVGRAAVSNWRRRYDDFPRPVGGTASSPLFSLAEVEDWLRRNGKRFEVSRAERVWQRLRAAADDLGLGELVADTGAALENGAFHADEQLDGAVAELGAREVFEFLYERYQEVHVRRLPVTPGPIAELMARLAGRVDTVFDPACGTGALLLAATASHAFGQDLDETAAAMAGTRLRLAGIDARVSAGDSLRQDAFAGELADAVLCDPPLNERAWGHEELAGDGRWEFGVPPRGEPELAWVQHCLSHARPGGTVAILLPPAVAGRRSGRRIRGNLLRAGALRAVVTMPDGTRDLWLLRRPEPGTGGDRVLLLESTEDFAAVEKAWAAPESWPTKVIDLIDDDVDLSPARHRGSEGGESFVAALAGFRARALVPPDLEVLDHDRSWPLTTIGELIKAGLVRKSGEGVPVKSPAGTEYRVDPERIDPDFLAGLLRSAMHRMTSNSTRLDLRRVRVPRLPLAEQRAYGRAFRRLAEFEAELAEAAALGERLVRLGFDGLADGHLQPGH
ncbi:N-6 DNA methylase [Amycolatopsis sp. 195334CR]|uniref:N-6 DNA methylase n=1 Tax=Amycolatopsis sp. 195334CR TaxID=2814588 RepID=UPI001A8E0988|nr:N-6 DNA methylase [Amycolatopsis sp. 195334CR]MBN6041723.1 N-6 DNA methylase [Amycolatopsis sp. 195334CR]